MTIVNTGAFGIRLLDHTYEEQEHRIYTPVLTAANIVAQRALQAVYQAAVDAVVIGTIIQATTTADIATEDAPVAPTDGSAQREMEWLVIYEDTVTFKPHKLRIGTPDMTASLRKPNQEFADMTQTVWVNYKAAFEAAAKSDIGNPVRITTIMLVGADS